MCSPGLSEPESFFCLAPALVPEPSGTEEAAPSRLAGLGLKSQGQQAGLEETVASAGQAGSSGSGSGRRDVTVSWSPKEQPEAWEGEARPGAPLACAAGARRGRPREKARNSFATRTSVLLDSKI